jgi:hypothetical protein
MYFPGVPGNLYIYIPNETKQGWAFVAPHVFNGPQPGKANQRFAAIAAVGALCLLLQHLLFSGMKIISDKLHENSK